VAISFISGAVGSGSSVTPGTHASGDLLFVLVRRLSATPPSIPEHFTNVYSNGANGISIRIGYRIATSSAEVSGTWTNGGGIGCAVYRGINTSDPIGAIGTEANGSSLDGVMNSLTLEVTDDTSWVVGCIGMGDGNAAYNHPDGLTNRCQIVGSTERGIICDTNAGVSTYAGDAEITDLNQSTSSYQCIPIEIKAASAGGPTVFQFATPIGLGIGLGAPNL
jgi:hypothetical protein